jgi:hypothetical protein
MRVFIHLDLSSRSFIPLARFIRSHRLFLTLPSYFFLRALTKRHMMGVYFSASYAFVVHYSCTILILCPLWSIFSASLCSFCIVTFAPPPLFYQDFTNFPRVPVDGGRVAGVDIASGSLQCPERCSSSRQRANARAVSCLAGIYTYMYMYVYSLSLSLGIYI